MRVLIHYQQNATHEFFEGDRLRKTLKGECENQGIPWSDNLFSRPEVAHFISQKDIGLMRKLSQAGAKTVVSAFYCEKDLGARMLKTESRQVVIRKNARKMLDEADVVLVPSIPIKKLCEKSGVKSQILVAPPCVNPDRFILSDQESALFLRYFGVSKERKYVLVIGNIYERKKIHVLLSLAKKMPRMRFYFFGFVPKGADFLIRHYNNAAPSNLRFSRILSDDVYRSAMKHASAYLILSSLPDGITMMEAFASKTPVIALGDQTLNPLLIDGVTGRICPKEEDLVASLQEILAGRGRETIISSFAIAKKNSIGRCGSFLQSVYELLLNQAKEAK